MAGVGGAVKMRTVVKQPWVESERGWGVRPDGYSLHKTKADRDAFIAEYWSKQPDETPDEYSRPEGECFLIDVDEGSYRKLAKTMNGIRVFEHDIVKEIEKKGKQRMRYEKERICRGALGTAETGNRVRNTT